MMCHLNPLWPPPRKALPKDNMGRTEQNDQLQSRLTTHIVSPQAELPSDSAQLVQSTMRHCSQLYLVFPAGKASLHLSHQPSSCMITGGMSCPSGHGMHLYELCGCSTAAVPTSGARASAAEVSSVEASKATSREPEPSFSCDRVALSSAAENSTSGAFCIARLTCSTFFPSFAAAALRTFARMSLLAKSSFSSRAPSAERNSKDTLVLGAAAAAPVCLSS
mmetsp:Transcript_12666/g.29753  ORF Transcript_12666/g.29753 Transcript_12666/m.29753 type:complete len:221 (+) Transcript_12666:52-714(+)